jgi:pyruvate,water dikinase
MPARELARRHAEAGDIDDPQHVFMLLDDELEPFAADPSSFREVLAERYATWRQLWDLEPPYFIKDGIVPPLGEWARKDHETGPTAVPGDVLQGVPGCAGTVTGRARIVSDPGDPRGLEPGDILVAPSTDPAWTPLFMSAGGVVVNVGGQISHSIIVCRELGLPCVVSATGATERLVDGSIIEVNGDTGEVTVVELPSDGGPS